MARQSRGLTKRSIQRRWKEGYGRGQGADYRPWLTVRGVSSRGQANRPLGCKTNRVHQLLSLNELHYFYLLEWSPLVVDIREQFPLWPFEETQEIAGELGLKHPSPPGGGQFVMTSDFRITLDDGREVVRAVKPAAALDEERTLQKLDIEREYWRRRDIDWGIVVAENVPLPVVKNIKWLHPYPTLDGLTLDPGDLPNVVRYLTEEVNAGTGDGLADIARRCDDELGLEEHTCLALARHLLATRQWRVDITTPINASRPLVLREA